MTSFIVKLLQGFAGLLDKWIPGQGARTVAIALIVIIGNIALFLAGQATPEQVAQKILEAIQALLNSLGGLATIFAALHKPKTP